MLAKLDHNAVCFIDVGYYVTDHLCGIL